MDNRQIKDGAGNIFTLRMRDISSAGDGSAQRSMIFSSSYPLDYGTGGMYQHCGKSGTMAAGLAANAVVYAFHWPANLLALVRRVRISAWSLGTGFTAGLASFDMYAVRSFTTQYGAGTVANLTSEYAQLRTAMAPSLAEIMYAATAVLTAGTGLLDADPLETRVATAPTTANTPFTIGGTFILFEKQQGEHPFMLAQNEGFVIRTTVPATGTWSFAVTTEWDEVSQF